MPIVLVLLGLAGAGGVALAVTRKPKGLQKVTVRDHRTAAGKISKKKPAPAPPPPPKNKGAAIGGAVGEKACQAAGLVGLNGICGSVGAKVGGAVSDAIDWLF